MHGTPRWLSWAEAEFKIVIESAGSAAVVHNLKKLSLGYRQIEYGSTSNSVSISSKTDDEYQYQYSICKFVQWWGLESLPIYVQNDWLFTKKFPNLKVTTADYNFTVDEKTCMVSRRSSSR